MSGDRDLLVSDVIRHAVAHSFERLVENEADLGRSDDPELVGLDVRGHSGDAQIAVQAIR